MSKIFKIMCPKNVSDKCSCKVAYIFFLFHTITKKEGVSLHISITIYKFP